MLAETGDFTAAAELVEQALEIVPDWAPGWDLLGRYLERAGEIQKAILAWRRLDALDADGVFGAPLKLAAHGAGLAMAETATAYVEALFDQYAPGFEAALLQKLDYKVPEMLARLVLEEARRRSAGQFAEALDLGCGTGLMGEWLRRHVSHLSGVDLSAGMVAEAGRKGIYDRLTAGEMGAFLAGIAPASADLVTAADVFVYSGALEPVFAGVARVLAPGGLFAFSIEAHDGPEALVLRPSLRYAHNGETARAALAAAGFEVIGFERQVLRRDGGVSIEGFVVLARRVQAVAGLPVAEREGEAVELVVN
ncbi:methyltransferase domain-containing protein [Arsenicitalea aurantiaca]|uniref:Methyltransferase domain-containing protein n=2 Tax=Arsenicitalea aurantiaca TaxID=1783274 RepID=A0A433XMA0_9HYPH|nr:methyltransferase domain-containing protein [Arsenicitalea aurantiaca]